MRLRRDSFEAGLSEKVSVRQYWGHRNENSSNYDCGENDKTSLRLLSTSFNLILTTTIGTRYYDYSHFVDEKSRGLSKVR